MTTITPTGLYELYTSETPIRPMTAVLFRSGGTWWIRHENGWETDTKCIAFGGNGYRKDDMIRLLTTGKG